MPACVLVFFFLNMYGKLLRYPSSRTRTHLPPYKVALDPTTFPTNSIQVPSTMSSGSLERRIAELRNAVGDLSDSVSGSGSSGDGRFSREYDGYENKYGKSYGRGIDVHGKSKCMSAGAIFCIVIVVLLAVAATIGGIMLTVRNRQQPDIVVVSGAGGPSAVALNQRRNTAKQTQTQAQEQLGFETERRRREAAFSQNHPPSQVSLKAAPAASSRGPAGIPTPGSVSSPRAVNMRTTRTQHTGAGSRLMIDSSSLPQPQPQTQPQPQAQAPAGSAANSAIAGNARRLQSAAPLLSSQSAALRPLGSNGSSSTRLAASTASSNSAAARSFESIKKSLSAGCTNAQIAKTNQYSYNTGICGGTNYFRNEVLVNKAAQIARELRAGIRCGPGGSSLPAASIAGFADYDPAGCAQ